MLMPALLLLALLSVFPLVYTLYQSFQDFYLLKPRSTHYIGWANYLQAVTDPYFGQSLGNTLIFMFSSTLGEILIGLLLALAFASVKKGHKALRFLILLPNLLPPVTAILVWQNLLSYQGVVNRMLHLIGQESYNWLGQPGAAMGSLVFIDLWQWSPFCFLMIYTALLAIPKSQYEAADLEGAQGWLRFRYIQWPHIRPTIGLLILLRSIDSFRLFDKVNILTKGGPANTTATISQFIFQKGIENMHLGYAAAVSVIMTILVLGLSLPGWRLGLKGES